MHLAVKFYNDYTTLCYGIHSMLWHLQHAMASTLCYDIHSIHGMFVMTCQQAWAGKQMNLSIAHTAKVTSSVIFVFVSTCGAILCKSVQHIMAYKSAGASVASPIAYTTQLL